MSKSIDYFFHIIKTELIYKSHLLNTFFIEINSTCNLNCSHCYIPEDQKLNFLNYEQIKKILSLVKKEWGNSVGIALTGGEPMLHPNIMKIIEEIHKQGFYWSLATNGTLLDKNIIEFLLKKKCTSITISIDGNEISHNKLRKNTKSYQKTIESINYLTQVKFPNIYITSTIHNDNVSSLNELGELVKKYKNVKWRINTLLTCENSIKNKLKITKDTYLKIVRFAKEYKEKYNIDIILGEKNPISFKYNEYFKSDFDNCLAGITTFGILSNGDIVNCMVCRDKILGNIKKVDSLKEIWAIEDLSIKGLCNRHIEAQ